MKHKEKILQLRAAGKSYSEISAALGCSKGTIAYHCGDGQKQKHTARRQRRQADLVAMKHERFRNTNTHIYNKTTSLNLDKSAKTKARDFQRRIGSKLLARMVKTFTFEDVVSLQGPIPKCYLTGDEIDLSLPGTYAFDHIVPSSQGGTNDIDNLGLCLEAVNRAKSDMTVEDFVAMCRKVTNYYA